MLREALLALTGRAPEVAGGAWWLFIAGPSLLRRILRIRRGGCPGCGYNRQGLAPTAPCPERGLAPPLLQNGYAPYLRPPVQPAT